MSPVPPALASLTDRLVAACNALRFAPPVTHVYNPLDYARPVWDQYCARYGQDRRVVLLCGMNPGPFGMAQVGVPFGEVRIVRDFLGLDGPVGKPAIEHPRVPVQGFACHRSEVSGARFWGWVRTRFGTPEAFFRQAFVANYCPLSFMEASGRNRTPDKLPASERTPLLRACDEALAGLIDHFQPQVVIGVGQFAEARLRAVADGKPGVQVGRVPHPSPASPAANQDWAGQMNRAWDALGLTLPAGGP
jgi:single-strand selective monofunctional uracil DNA glycosylase